MELTCRQFHSSNLDFTCCNRGFLLVGRVYALVKFMTIGAVNRFYCNRVFVGLVNSRVDVVNYMPDSAKLMVHDVLAWSPNNAHSRAANERSINRDGFFD